MGLLVAILVVAALLLGFLFLTSVEARRGRRVLEGTRRALDRKVEDAALYITSTDGRTSLIRTVRTLRDHIVHDIVHAILLAVRFVERTLTKLAREIRGRRAKEAQENGSGSVE
jgi:hypothetical protein